MEPNDEKQRKEDAQPPHDLECRRKVIEEYIADLRAFLGQAPAQVQLKSRRILAKRLIRLVVRLLDHPLKNRAHGVLIILLHQRVVVPRRVAGIAGPDRRL
jgi:hypothetical protein